MTSNSCTDAVAWLRTTEAIRARCNELYSAACRGQLDHFTIDEGRYDAIAGYVAASVRDAYPALDIPFHSRWRHFSIGGLDRWAELRASLGPIPREEVARTRFDLAVTSVLLDAGAGGRWSYNELTTGRTFSRSEGLGVASINGFETAMFGGRIKAPRATAERLQQISAHELSALFQVGDANPLVGIEGRASMLNRLGHAVAAAPRHFGADARVGNLFDHFTQLASGGHLRAAAILTTLLDAFGPVWPAAIVRQGRPLGDVWPHPAVATTNDATTGLVPFHKLAQWLAYSLIEPLEDGGIIVEELDSLTGLAEYRNGGLFIDLDLIVPRRVATLSDIHQVGSTTVVEWRALTVAALDRLAPLIRVKLGCPDLSLAKILEGGTWRAGRQVAQTKRADGSPPIRVASDGTVF